MAEQARTYIPDALRIMGSAAIYLFYRLTDALRENHKRREKTVAQLVRENRDLKRAVHQLEKHCHLDLTDFSAEGDDADNSNRRSFRAGVGD